MPRTELSELKKLENTAADNLAMRQRFSTLIKEMRGEMSRAKFKKYLSDLLGFSYGAIDRWEGVNGVSGMVYPLSVPPEVISAIAGSRGWTEEQVLIFIWNGGQPALTPRIPFFEIKKSVEDLPLKDVVILAELLNNRILKAALENQHQGKKVVAKVPTAATAATLKTADLNDRQLFNLKKVIAATIDLRGFRDKNGQTDYFSAAMSTGVGSRLLANAISEIELGGKPRSISPEIKKGIALFCCRVKAWEPSGTPVVLAKSYEGDWNKLIIDLDYSVNRVAAFRP